MIALLFLIIHGISSSLMACGIKRGRFACDPGMIGVLCLLPYFGEALVLLVSYRTAHGLTGQKADAIRRDEEVTAEASEGFFENDIRDTAIPLEDALFVNNAAQRQRILRDAILAGSEGNGALLEQARRDDNPEIVHFATTAMAHADSEFEKKQKELEERLAATPDDIAVMDELIELLRSYLEHPTDESIRKLRLQRYTDLLSERVKKHPTPEFMDRLSAACLDGGDMEEAERMIKMTDLLYPNDPENWILRFRMYYMRRDREAMADMVADYHDNPDLRSTRIDRIIAFWTSGKEAASS